MSSYLNFYLVPKKNNIPFEGEQILTVANNSEEKPLLLASYSRNNPIYQAVSDAITVPYAFKDDKCFYIDLTKGIIDSIIHSVYEDLNQSKKRQELNTKAFNEIKSHTSDEYNTFVEDYTSMEEYIDELTENYLMLKGIGTLFNDIGESYCAFSKVLINID